MPRRGQFHHGAAASAWDSDSMFYVGMEYPNLGACSQKAPTSFQSRGSSPKTVVTSIDTASAGTLGELTLFVLSRCLCAHVNYVEYTLRSILLFLDTCVPASQDAVVPPTSCSQTKVPPFITEGGRLCTEWQRIRSPSLLPARKTRSQRHR